MTVRVGLTMRITHAADYQEPRDSISHDWLKRLTDWEFAPLPVPNIGESITDWLDQTRPDIVIITGGDDPTDMTIREITERELLNRASKIGLPILGVCRGLQCVNLHFGGRLTEVDGHVGSPHGVSFDVGWRQHYGAESVVNSFHNLGIIEPDLGDGLDVTARDAQGHIEAVRHRDLPMAAVMWHPERAGSPAGDRRLIGSLIDRRPGA